MLRFLRRHRGVHIWLAVILALFAVYGYGVSSRRAANAVCAVTQRIKDGLGAACYLVPFSVVEWLYLGLGLGAAVWIAVTIRRLIRRKGERGHTLYSGVMGLLCLALSIWAAFSLLWGVNYKADSFRDVSGLTARPASVDELERVTALFARELAELADQVERDENGVFAEDREEILAAAPAVYQNLYEVFPFLEREDRVPKPLLFSKAYSAMQFTGFFSPFTGESNVNVDSPACLLPATVAHELAHQRGVASEQECNFLAIAACDRCDNVVYRYSGYLKGFIHLNNALYAEDRDRWQAVRSLLPETVEADLRDHSAYWARFDGITGTVTQKVYDATLKSYGLTDGVKSYGTVVDLLIAYF